MEGGNFLYCCFPFVSVSEARIYFIHLLLFLPKPVLQYSTELQLVHPNGRAQFREIFRANSRNRSAPRVRVGRSRGFPAHRFSRHRREKVAAARSTVSDWSRTGPSRDWRDRSPAHRLPPTTTTTVRRRSSAHVLVAALHPFSSRTSAVLVQLQVVRISYIYTHTHGARPFTSHNSRSPSSSQPRVSHYRHLLPFTRRVVRARFSRAT